MTERVHEAHDLVRGLVYGHGAQRQLVCWPLFRFLVQPASDSPALFGMQQQHFIVCQKVPDEGEFLAVVLLGQ